MKINIFDIENYYFVLFLVLSLYIIIINPNNLIPFFIYSALFYIPINLIYIYQNKRYLIINQRFELAHRIMFITIGIIPLLSPISQPITNLLTFQ